MISQLPFGQGKEILASSVDADKVCQLDSVKSLKISNDWFMNERTRIISCEHVQRQQAYVLSYARVIGTPILIL
jgi:hypothetical protein